MSYSGKTAIITGGSKGIGRAVAEAFVAAGGSVCIVARDVTALEAAAVALRAKAGAGQFVETIAADTTDQKAFAAPAERFMEKHGTPDYLMNFVGYAYPQYFEKLTLADFRKNMDTNYYGQLVPILTLVPRFLARGSGHVVTCSSILGYLGTMGYATYCPSKYAILGLTESLRNELAPRGIRFSVLFPPDTETPGFDTENQTKPREVHIMSESGGLLSPHQVAEILLKGLKRRRFYIHAGQSRMLWRLTRLFPSLAHRILDSELAKAKKKMALRQ